MHRSRIQNNCTIPQLQMPVPDQRITLDELNGTRVFRCFHFN